MAFEARHIGVEFFLKPTEFQSIANDSCGSEDAVDVGVIWNRTHNKGQERKAGQERVLFEEFNLKVLGGLSGAFYLLCQNFFLHSNPVIHGCMLVLSWNERMMAIRIHNSKSTHVDIIPTPIPIQHGNLKFH